MAYVNKIDIAKPAGGDDPREADDNMRRIQAGFQEILAVEHNVDLTGTEITGNGYHKTPFNVVAYGADPTGVADSTAAFQDAVDAMETNKGGIIFMPEGSYKFLNTVYLDNAENNLTYHFKGEGKGTILKPDGFTTKYLFKLNEDSGGVKIIAFPHAPRAIFENFQVDGTDSTSASFLWYNEASFIMRQLKLRKLQYGAYGTAYTDMVTLEYIHWYQPIAGGYLYRQGSNGDGFYARQLFGGDVDMMLLFKAAGATIENCIGGHYVFRNCVATTIRNSHFESSVSAPAITVNNSHITIENNWLENTKTYEPILLDEGAGYRDKMDVTIKNNVFATYISASDSVRVHDIKIDTWSASQSNLRLINNKNYIFGLGRWIFDKAGIRITATDATLDTFLTDKKFYLSGDVSPIFRDGVWVLDGNSKPSLVVNNPSLTVTESASYPGSIASGTQYFYTAAILTEIGNTQKAGEAEDTATVDDRSMNLVISTRSDRVVLRIWRGVATGVYNRYVDIPMTDTLNNEFYDTGTHVAGYIWIAAGVPTPPTSNTTGRIAHADATPTVLGVNYLITSTTGVTITRFDDGVVGQQLTLVSKGATIYDTSTATRLIGSSVDIITASGDVTMWVCEIGGTVSSVWRLKGFVDVSANNSGGA